VGRLLKKKRLTVATAESCTGGMVAARITSVPGSSRYFLGSVVSYSNEVKTNVLGVSPETIRRHGAVSSETAAEMAEGVCRVVGADVGIAVTGVAGPSGGTKVKPVGLVCVCVRVEGQSVVERHLFHGGRRAVKEQSAAAALELCRRVLKGGV